MAVLLFGFEGDRLAGGRQTAAVSGLEKVDHRLSVPMIHRESRLVVNRLWDRRCRELFVPPL